MSSLRAILWSSVIKKFINAVTGLALCGFIIVHLLGNIALLTGRAEAFNKYSHFLLSTGLLIYLAEIAMVGVFLFHAIAAVTVWRPAGQAESRYRRGR
jgi:succinate dehydrogenase / fumarate reductase cytochrome b subunit